MERLKQNETKQIGNDGFQVELWAKYCYMGPKVWLEGKLLLRKD